MALRKEGRSLAVYVWPVRCVQIVGIAQKDVSRKKQRGGGVGCVSRSLPWRRIPLSERLEQAFYVVVKNMYYICLHL